MTAGRSTTVSSTHWCTPPQYVAAVKAAFSGSIALDPCSNNYSIVSAEIEYRLPEVDGLTASWDFTSIYVNPPYGRDKERGTTIKDWLNKCNKSHALYGAEVIALVPVATNTSHWKECIWGVADSVCFLYDTRLKFLEEGRLSKKGAPMACATVYWGKNRERFTQAFQQHGFVVALTQ